MNNNEALVSQHYGDKSLLERIMTGLKASGADLNRLRTEDLAPIEEFHIGGRKATIHVVEKMSLHKNQYVLDIGCGIGGAARYISEKTGCKVRGIDLTPEFITIANILTKLTKQNDKVTFDTASALAMPIESATFDAAITLHVAMNIKDRSMLYSEIARVLKPGAVFCLFDVMRKNDEILTFPLPWAISDETNYLTTPEEMCVLLDEAGFDVQEVEDRTDFALDFFKESLANSEIGHVPFGIHLVMGDSATEKMNNVVTNIKNGRIAPVQMLATRK